MIEKSPEIQIHSCAKINEKLNEVIDWVNDVSALRVTDKQVTANLPNIDAGELAFLSKENSDLKDEVEKLQKQLNIATNGLNAVHYTIVNNNDLLGTVYRMKNIAGESLDELKGGDNE